MRIWLINHFAVPIKYYPLARTTNFAKYLIHKGHEVTIFCASSVHNSDLNLIKNGSLYKEETVDGIPYVYVRCRSYQSKVQRVLNMLDFAWNLKKVCEHYEKPDVMMVSSQTPFACMWALRMAKRMKVKSIIEVTDLWPENFVSRGMIGNANPILIAMRLFEKKMYEYADDVVFSMEGGYDYIKERGWEEIVPKSKVHYINNGVELEIFDQNKNSFQIEDEDLEDERTFKIVYTGAIRYANNLGMLIDVAKIIKNQRVKFLIWGKGDELLTLKKRLDDECIYNFTFKGYVDKKYIPYIAGKADLNIVHFLDVPLIRFGISPNKLFDYMAAGKPILSTFSSQYNPATQEGAGLEVCHQTVDNIAKMIEKFVFMDKKTYDKLCRNARKGAEKYEYKNLTRMLLRIMTGESNNEASIVKKNQ